MDDMEKAEKAMDEAEKLMDESFGRLENFFKSGKGIKGLFEGCWKLLHSIAIWNIHKKDPETTLLIAPQYHTVEATGRKEIKVELLMSVLTKGNMRSIEGVIFERPEHIMRLADQMSSLITKLRKIASELEDRQNASSPVERKG